MMFDLMVTYDPLPSAYEISAERDRWRLLRVEGLTPPPVNVNTSAAGAVDGTFFNSAVMGQRNIVLTIMPRGNISENRRQIYKMFPLHKEIQLIFSDYYDSTNKYINGYVESIEGSLFDNPETLTISIICPRPYFESASTSTNIASAAQGGTNLRNDGDTETGFEVDITISSDVPTGTRIEGLTITNATTGKFIGFSAIFQKNDRIHISTINGQLEAVLNRQSISTPINLMNYLTDNSTWFKLKTGTNYLGFSTTNSTESYVSATVSRSNLYGGV